MNRYQPYERAGRHDEAWRPYEDYDPSGPRSYGRAGRDSWPEHADEGAYPGQHQGRGRRGETPRNYDDGRDDGRRLEPWSGEGQRQAGPQRGYESAPRGPIPHRSAGYDDPWADQARGFVGRETAGGYAHEPSFQGEYGGASGRGAWRSGGRRESYGGFGSQGFARGGQGSERRSSPGTESFAGRGPKNFQRSDERIREAVSESLEQADDVDASEIEVEVKQGVVTLKGTVASRAMKRSAEECIENLPGVKDVTNQVRVESGDREDGAARSGSERTGSMSSGKSTTRNASGS